MTLFQQIDRMEYIHNLIKNQSTGNPETFAKKLRLSRRQLYNILEEMRILGLDIRYSKIRETYYYNNNKFLVISYSLSELSKNELKTIAAGSKISSKCNKIALCCTTFASVI